MTANPSQSRLNPIAQLPPEFWAFYEILARLAARGHELRKKINLTALPDDLGREAGKAVDGLTEEVKAN